MASQNPIAKTIQDTKIEPYDVFVGVPTVEVDAQKVAEEKRALPLPNDFVVLTLSEDDLYGGPENKFIQSDEGVFGFNGSDIDQTEDYIAQEAIRRLLNRFEAPQELVNILGQDVVENVDDETAYQKLLEKGYTRADIIDQLTNLEDAGLGKGFITEFPKATAAGYAGTRAARFTAPLGSPLGPAGMAVTGTLGFLGGAGLSYFG
jgi:hypothetical protein